MPEQQDFRAWLAGEVPVVPIPAQINRSNSVQLRTALLSAGSKSATIVVDMSQTLTCDSAALTELVRAHKRATAEGGELRLVITHTQVLRIFATTGMDRTFPIFADLPEALSPGAEPPPTGLSGSPATRPSSTRPPASRRDNLGGSSGGWAL